MSYNWPTMPGHDDPYQNLIQALLGQAPDNTGSNALGQLGADGAMGISPELGQMTPSLQPRMAGNSMPDLAPGWLDNTLEANSPAADSHFNKIGAANLAQSPIFKAMLSALSPVPGTSSAADAYAGYWLNKNVGSGNTARALGLGYPDMPEDTGNQQVADPQKFYASGGGAGPGAMHSSMYSNQYGRLRPRTGGIATGAGASGVDKKKQK